ncbi:hypothetical protein BKA62DRAFT_706733 [Auriculariales sp. MPI-PUGE-AT-0066]|nr:hypothetical protein BKA62DRAFT_706733 [Auriculariales sp. MPI-PUGE-AT-0066]
MPAPTHFLGLELAPDALRAIVVDDGLEHVATEAVEFDQTGDQLAPVDIWVTALDVLLESLTRKCDLGRIKAISGSAHNATILWSTESAGHLANLSPLRPLNAQLTFPATPGPGVARATGAGAFLASVLLGRWSAASEAEALWRSDVTGEVERFGGRVLGTISSYFVNKYGFDKDAFLVPFIPTPLATYLSHVPAQGEAVLAFGPFDFLLIPATPNMNLDAAKAEIWPHPALDVNEPRRSVAVLSSRNADTPRGLVRDMYTKSWSAFDRLIAVVPPGGSIGLDDKLFAFWLLQSDGLVKGIFRFETGVKVGEFRDLRANPRCLVESQLLSMRVRAGRLSAPPPLDLHDSSHLPRRIYAVGAAASFPSIVNMVGDIFNTEVVVSDSLLDGARRAVDGGWYSATAASAMSPGGAAITEGAGLALSGGSGAIGSAYLARWAWRRLVRPDETAGSFENEVRATLARRVRTQTQQRPGLAVRTRSHLIPAEDDYTSTSPSAMGPDGLNGSSTPVNGSGSSTFTPVAPVQTSEGDAALGLARVAEPDSDAFAMYAAQAVEWSRLEGLLSRALV